jgi:hypothetical protein
MALPHFSTTSSRLTDENAVGKSGGINNPFSSIMSGVNDSLQAIDTNVAIEDGLNTVPHGLTVISHMPARRRAPMLSVKQEPIITIGRLTVSPKRADAAGVYEV